MVIRTQQVEKLLPRLADDYCRLVENLADSLESVDVSKARAELRSLLGDIRVKVDDEEARFMVAGIETALARASGGPQINVVAGAGFEPATFGL